MNWPEFTEDEAKRQEMAALFFKEIDIKKTEQIIIQITLLLVQLVIA